MRKRERLLRISGYDIMCRLNKEIMDVSDKCVLELIGKASGLSFPKSCDGKSCENCIGDWLNEEENPQK